MRCSQCGHILPDDVVFCPNCGHKVGSLPGTVPAPQPVPAVQAPQLAQTVLAPSPLAPGLASHPANPNNLAGSSPNVTLPPPPASFPAPTPPPYGSTPTPPLYGAAPPALPPIPGTFVPLQPVSPAQSHTLRDVSISAVLTLTLVGLVLLALFSTGTILTQQSANATVTALSSSSNGTVAAQATSAATDNSNSQATVTAQAATATQVASDAQATKDALALTPTPYPPYTESQSPSGATFEAAAQHIILSAQLANGVNSQNQPTALLSVFTPGQTFYLSYEWAQGNSGYVYLKYYFNGSYAFDTKSDYVDNKYGYGYFYAHFNRAGQGAVEVYYCGQSDCSDKQLAWVRPFTIRN